MAARQNSLPELPVQDGVRFRVLPIDDRYCVGSDGSFYSRVGIGYRGILLDHWCQRKPRKDPYGYMIVKVGRKPYRLHRLVLLTFRGPSTGGNDCRHLDGCRTNNRLENLAWGTRKQNMDDRAAHGRTVRGQASCNAIVSDAEARAIQRLRWRHPGAKGFVNFLARWFGIAPNTVSQIAHGIHYAHVKSDAPARSES